MFFIVPRAWTDFYLPLEISVPAEINRVMVGRIELVTPEDRRGLEKIARFSATEITEQAGQLWTNFTAMVATRYNQEWGPLASGRKRLAASVSVPESYQTYLDLGRFRNALILDEAKNRPTKGLTNFIATYRLQAYKPLESPAGLK